MAKKIVRIGFVGVGGMGQCAHLRNYVTVPDCKVVALAELRTGLGAKVAARYDVPAVYSDYESMLRSEDLDAIVASQPFERHGVLVPELLKAGIPVFTEKPLASTVPAGERIVKAMKRNRTWMMVGYHKRSDPATMYAKAEIDRLKSTGELGPMRYVRILMPAGDWIAGGFTGLIRSDEPLGKLATSPCPSDMSPRLYKQYILFVNYYIHQVNLLRHLLGEPYKVTFADRGGVLFVAESKSGVTGVIEMSPYHNTVDWQESALVAFDKGYVKIELPAPLASNRAGRVEIMRDPGKGVMPQTIVPQFPWIHAMRQQAMNFVKAVQGDAEPMCRAEEALEDLKVARDYLRLFTGK